MKFGFVLKIETFLLINGIVFIISCFLKIYYVIIVVYILGSIT